MALSDQLDRAELFAYDSQGRKIKRVPKDALGYTVMPVKETKRHALSNATVVSAEDEARQAQEREAQAQWDKLDDQTREIVRLNNTQRGTVERERHVETRIVCTLCIGKGFIEEVECVRCEAQGSLDGYAEAERQGWTHRGDGRFTKGFVDCPTQVEIAEQLHISVYAVRKALSSVSAEMVRYAILKAWL